MPADVQARLVMRREGLRQAERMLVVQHEARESALRRAAELLRLAIATLGAVVLVAGILATTMYQPDLPVALATTFGVLAIGFSVVRLSRVIAGESAHSAFASGPDLKRVLEASEQEGADEMVFYGSLIRSAAAWIADNGVAIAQIQDAKARALNSFLVGAGVLLGSGVYILGSAIYV